MQGKTRTILLLVVFVVVSVIVLQPHVLLPSSSVPIYAAESEKTPSESMWSPPIAELCASTVWQPDVYVSCNNIHMGAFNAINRLQVCIRYAMDMGAGLILPILTDRGNTSLKELYMPTNRDVGLDFLMDDTYLWEALKVNCPSMQVRTQSSLANVKLVDGVQRKNLTDRVGKGAYLRKATYITNEYKRRPLILQQWEPLIGWLRDSDPLEFQLAFRDIFKYNPIFLELAHNIMGNLPASYFGIHLRMEDDFWYFTDREWGMGHYLNLLPNSTDPSGRRVAYVACGNVTQLERFIEKGKERGVEVTHKWPLLSEAEQAYARTLSFDQLAIIDKIVLDGSSIFYGLGVSSFSYAVGLERHAKQTRNLNFKPGEEDNKQYLLGIVEAGIFKGAVW